MTKTTDSLPEYLRKVCTVQDYESLHAKTTRVLALYHEASSSFFQKGHAVSIYEEGLRKSAIYTDSIPNINKMDESMQSFGWG